MLDHSGRRQFYHSLQIIRIGVRELAPRVVAAMHAEAESRARAGNPGPAPSLGMSLGLDLAGAAIDAYSTYHVSAPSRRGDIKSASSTKKRPPTYPGI